MTLVRIDKKDDTSRDKIFRDKLIALITHHAKHSNKVIREVRVKWNSSGHVNAYAFEYERKSK